jgi:hypothetical protein
VRKGGKDGGAHHELEGVHDVGSGAERQDVAEEWTAAERCSGEHGTARTNSHGFLPKNIDSRAACHREPNGVGDTGKT